MTRSDEASRLGMVVFLLISAFLHVRERIWDKRATRAEATVLGSWTWHGGRLWNRTPAQIVEVKFLERDTLTKGTLRAWTHRYKTGDVLKVAYEPGDPTVVFPASNPLAERPSTIMAVIGGFFAILSVAEFIGRRRRRKVDHYLKTLERVNPAEALWDG